MLEKKLSEIHRLPAISKNHALGSASCVADAYESRQKFGTRQRVLFEKQRYLKRDLFEEEVNF